MKIDRKEWVWAGLTKDLIRPTIEPKCAIGGYIESPIYDAADPYDTRFGEISSTQGWLDYGMNQGWITDIGCIEHELDTFNFIFVLDEKEWHSVESLNLEYIAELLDMAQFKSKCDTIFDIGCGTGNILDMSFDHGYKNAMGIEIRPAIYDVANSNSKLEVYHEDAANYILPDKRMHLYMFDPFSNTILDSFLQNNIENIKKNKSMLIYANAFSGHHLVTKYGMQVIYSDGLSVIYTA
jgi:hypothetical protein